jgi:triosephosphate isomerase (TIM)
MTRIFVNLKRFDVPREFGGICPEINPAAWIRGVMSQLVNLGISSFNRVEVLLFLPESLIITALEELSRYPIEKTQNIFIGSQTVYRNDIEKGKNFGAFTANFPAKAAAGMGCSWTMIGHSEERKDKKELLSLAGALPERITETVNLVLNKQVLCALKNKMNVLLCAGETFEEQSRWEEVIRDQIITGLLGADKLVEKQKIVIGYEPVWAIGPGKIPPGKEYIAKMSKFIKEVALRDLGITVEVVYGGGLKEENVGMISSIATIDGGLVALTKFTGDIAFEPEGLKIIIEKYIEEIR